MDILLISPDYKNRKNNFPWGVLSLASFLASFKNYEVELLDASAYSEADFLNRLKNYCKKTRLIGISMMSTDTYFVKNVVDYIKDLNQEIKIIVGGSHAMLDPQETCLYKNIDFVAYSEGELTVAGLIHETKLKTYNYERIPGLIYKTDTRVIKTKAPAWSSFYDINYGLLPETTKRTLPEYIQVLTGRGCSFKCTFCFNSVCGSSWRGRPISEIINELEGLVQAYAPKVIYFRDENFFHSKQRILEFISSYRDKKFKFRWRANCRASYFSENYLNFELLKELESINCEALKFGLESGSQRVLNYLKKGIRVESVKDLVCTLSKLKNIKAYYSFMIGLPTETPQEYLKTLALIRFINKNDPRAVIIGPQYFRMYPGGELYEEIIKNYHYSKPDSFEEWAVQHSPKMDPYGFSKNIRYPWICRKYTSIAQHADTLVLLYQQNLARYFKIRLIVHLPFILLAKLRFRLGWFGGLYDVRLVVFLKRAKERARQLLNRDSE